MNMGPYCRYCDQRCFVERRMPDDAEWRPGETVNLATCQTGSEHDREETGYDYLTAINPRRPPIIPAHIASTLWVELLAVHVAARGHAHEQLERRQMARSYRNGMVAVYARATGQAEETVMEALDAASVEHHEKETAS